MHIFELATSRVFLKDFLKMIGILVTNSFTALLEAPEIKIPRVEAPEIIVELTSVGSLP